MKPPDLPDNEAERVRLLHELRILDTGDEPAFDAIARMVCLLSGCTIGALSLVDTERQWFKAIVGLGVRETPRRHSPCARSILRSGITVVEDMLADPELATHPLVIGGPCMRFYAAAPVSVEGQAIGTVCCIADTPRTLSDVARDGLRDLAELTSQLLQTRLRERRWRLQEARVRAASRSANDWLWETDAQGRVTWLSENLQMRADPSPPHAVGESWPQPYEAMAVRRPSEWTRCQQAFARREPFSQVLTDWNSAQGMRTISSSGQPVFDTARRFKGFRGSSRDVSAELEVKQSLALSEERCKLALEGASQGVWDWDARKKGVYYSDAWKAIVGHASHEIGSSLKEWLRRIHPDDLSIAKAKLFAHIRGATPLYVAEHRMRHKAGHDVWVLNSGKVVRRSKSGRVLRMVGTLTDITAQRQTEAALRDKHAAEMASRTKSEFLSRMSHEMRTPLNAVIGFSQLLLNRPGLADASEVHDYAEHVLHAGEHLLALTNNVLDLQQLEEGHVALELADVALDALLAEVLAQLAPMALAQGVAFDNHVDAGHRLRADERRLRQVLLSIASNAIKYNRPGGVVRCSVDDTDPQCLRLSIEDTGSGIAANKVDRLFQPFERLGRETSTIEGTGLGLMIARSLIIAMKGTLLVLSRSGEGTRVVIELPVASAAAQPASIAETSAEPITARRAAAVPSLRMLYVEDNRINAILFEEAIRLRDGVELRLAEDGPEALFQVRGWRPDVLVLDAHLPGIDGFELLHLLRREPGLEAVPAFMCSADAMPDDVQRAADAGFVGYWPKPINIAKIMSDLDQLGSGAARSAQSAM
ncbi:MAG TPA: ATP-binding protein [Albitalea sp.]|nr:ATP-binding protein [Albitalea sp.]